MRESAVLRAHRVARKLHAYKIPLIPNILIKLNRIIFSADIPLSVYIGEGAQFYHNGLGVVIHENAKIGSGVKIYQNVTIGGRGDGGAPDIQANVFIGCGACVLGKITIGENTKIGANSTVIDNVPANSLVVGFKAVIKENNN